MLTVETSALVRIAGWSTVVAIFGLTVATALVGMLTSGPILWAVCVGLLAALLAWLGSLTNVLLARSALA